MWIYRQITYNPAKFGGHRHSESWNIAVLVCLVNSQDHVFKESCDFIDKSL